MHFELLADRTEAIPIIAKWHFDQWGRLDPDGSLEQTCSMISEWLNRDRAPLMLLAIENDIVTGTAALKPHEMLSVFPDFTPWLGSVFVHPDYRHRSIASQLCREIISLATSLGIGQLFLQTERLDGGLYGRLGWKPIDQLSYRGRNVLVMRKELRATKPAY
jgi:GNAT superfamily N-acetyltransferase